MPPALAEQQFETLKPQVFSRPDLVLHIGGGDTTARTASLELAPRSREDHVLSDVDDLEDNVRPDGSYDPVAVASIRQNKNTFIIEGAMPDVISEVRQQWIPSPESKRGGLIMALGRTSVETAMRGESWYRYKESKARGKVEVKHAIYNQENLEAGVALIKVAAKMTEIDGSREIAKAEGVADTDSIQVDWLDLDNDTQSGEAVTNCLLVPNVPSEAWADWLADPDNIFGKAISVRDKRSGLAIMEAYDGMEVPLSKLPEGPLTILAAVVPYIKDPTVREKVAAHVETIRNTNQEEMRKRAASPAERMLEFDMSTEQSRRTGLANPELVKFIKSLEGNWGDKDRATIEEHRMRSGKYAMSRKLEAVLQNAKRNMILSAAAVVAGNKAVLDQLPEEAARSIRLHEIAIQTAHHAGMDIQALQAGMNQIIARFNIKVGGGCNGDNRAGFKIPGLPIVDSEETASESDGPDGKGSLTFKCPQKGCGYINTRPLGGLLECCKDCKKPIPKC